MSLLEVDKGLPLSDRGPKGRATHGVATSRTEMPWIKLKIQLWHQWSHSGQVRKLSNADRTVAWENRKKVSSSKFAAGKRLVKVNVTKPVFSNVRENMHWTNHRRSNGSKRGILSQNDTSWDWQWSMPKLNWTSQNDQKSPWLQESKTCHWISRHETKTDHAKVSVLKCSEKGV